MTRKSVLFLFMFIVSSGVFAKATPFDGETISLLSGKFLEGHSVSIPKVEAYEARLKQKLFEVSSIIANNERRLGETDEKEIAEKVEDSDSIIAFKRCLTILSEMKAGGSLGDLLDQGHDVLDLEGAIRIEGHGNSIMIILEQVRNYFGKWVVPYTSYFEEEASNLFEPVSQSYLGAENMKGLDLSLFDPGPKSTFWENPKDLASRDVKKAALGELTTFYKNVSMKFPTENRFKFSEMKYSDTKPKMDVFYKDAEGKKVKFKLKIGAEIHADPTVASIMMTLGYGADVTRYAKDIRVDLGKKYTLSDLKRDWEIYYHRDNTRAPFKIEGYIKESGTDESGNFVVFKEGLLEAKPKKIGRLGGWSFKELGNGNLREVRGMTIIQMWLDNTDLKEFENNKILVRGDRHFHIVSDLGKALGGVFGEKPELLKNQMVSSRDGGGLTFNYHAFHPVAIKNKMTFADARWGTRLLGTLSRQQITDAVNEGHWPACVAKIYTEKLISRRNDLITNFNLVGQKDRAGRTLEIMPLILTPEQMEFDLACKPADLEGSTVDFNFSTDFLMRPIYRSALNALMGMATSTINSSRNITFHDAELEFRGNIISQMIFDLRREVEQNPNPKSENDLFIVRDHFEIGMRLGAAFGLYKDFLYTRTYSLAYPVRTREEARLNNGFIVNVLLPRDVRTGNLPPKYVLHTDHFFQSGIGIDADDVTKPIALTIRAKLSKARVLRSIIDHRSDEKIVIYRDRTDYSEAFLRAFVRAGVVKLPLLTTFAQWGSASGAGSVITKADLDADPTLEKSIHAAATTGDFSGLKVKEEDFFLRNRFEARNFNWSFIFWRGQTDSRLDRISIDREGDNDDENLLQFRTNRSRSWSFLGRSEKKTVTAEVLATPDQKSYQLKLKVGCLDSSTKDKELEDNYLFFINGLSVTGEKIIPFTPSLGYTTNGKWGPLLTTSETTYYREGIDRILALQEQDLWKSIGAGFGVKFATLLSDYQDAKDEIRSSSLSEQDSILRSYGIASEDYELLSKTETFLRDMKSLRKEFSPEKRIKKIGKIFRGLAFRHRAGFFDPRLVGALNRIAGTENIYSMNMISSPPFVELNMIEGAPLFGQVGKARPDEQGYLNYIPETPLEQYYLFNNWRIL